MLQRSLYRSLLRSARELQGAAAAVSADPGDELRKFFSPAQLLKPAPRARGGKLVAAVRRQFALHRTHGAAETDELVEHVEKYEERVDKSVSVVEETYGVKDKAADEKMVMAPAVDSSSAISRALPWGAAVAMAVWPLAQTLANR